MRTPLAVDLSSLVTLSPNTGKAKKQQKNGGNLRREEAVRKTPYEEAEDGVRQGAKRAVAECRARGAASSGKKGNVGGDYLEG